MKALRDDKRYTYEDYCSWDDGNRYELIDGAVWQMSAPLTGHQIISREILLQLGIFLDGKHCEVFDAPFDVRLDADGADDTVVQPDIFVVCDLSKIDRRGLRGAPDLIIEILSPSTAKRDKVVKLNKYLKAGVREYWIVDPDSSTVHAFTLQDGNYVIKAYAETDDAPVAVLEGCVIRLEEIFARAKPFMFDEEGATISGSST